MITSPKTPPKHPKGASWSRLSESLTGERHPERCQACGAHGEFALGPEGLARWIEHDQNDEPEQIVVVLCPACSEMLIEQHPRMYDCLPPNNPWAGCMAICVDCQWRSGVSCLHPRAKSNGGPGVMLTIAQPFVAHVDGRRGPKGGRRCGWTIVEYPYPAAACEQKDESDLAADE